MNGTSEPGPRVVILNGVGSVGKSSIARALQTIADDPFLHVEMDAFIAMLPDRCWGDPDGFDFERGVQDGLPSVRIRTGRLGACVLSGLWQAVRSMAGEGADLIVDVVFEGAPDLAGVVFPGNADVRMVGVFAPLDVLEARERRRDDRMIGLARWQFGRVHEGIAYDLEVDAAAETPLRCAQRIKDAFGL